MNMQASAANQMVSKRPVRSSYRKGAAAAARILDAAEELFCARGFEGVSINDVAELAGVTKALVFYHYETKQDLFDAVLDRYYASQAESLMKAAPPSDNFRERIHSVMDAYLDFIEQHPGYPRLIQWEVCSGSRNLDRILKHMKPLQKWGEAAFTGLLPADGPASPRHFFLTMFSMGVNYFNYSPVIGKLWGVDPMTKAALAERRNHVHIVIDSILDGLKTQLEAGRAAT